jgi:plasmid maintenance system antidote protein VapI
VREPFVPAAVFSVAEYVREELKERRWAIDDLARRAGISVDHAKLLVDPLTELVSAHFEALSRAFGTSVTYWRSLYEFWCKYPERRVMPEEGESDA